MSNDLESRRMSDFATYEAVSKSPDWTGVDPHKLISHLAKKYEVSEAAARQIAFVFIGWTLDNESNIKELWGNV